MGSTFSLTAFTACIFWQIIKRGYSDNWRGMVLRYQLDPGYCLDRTDSYNCQVIFCIEILYCGPVNCRFGLYICIMKERILTFNKNLILTENDLDLK